MTLRLGSRSLYLASSLLPLVGLVGCGAPDARFADASPEQLRSAYRAATGQEVMGMLAVGVELSGKNDPQECPAIVSEGQDTISTGDCTDEDGLRIAGSIAIHNLPSDEEGSAYDPSQPGSIELDLRISFRDNEPVVIDGRVDVDGSRISSDLTFDVGGTASTSRLILDCELDIACSASPGSEIELSDLGVARVEGSWNLGFPPSGRVTLRGADVLVFDLDGSEGDCVFYTIGDKQATLCPDDGDDDGEAAAALAGPRAGTLSRLLRAAMP